MIKLCNTEDIPKMIDTIGIFSSVQIDNEILEQTEFIYDNYSEPLSAIVSNVGVDENNDFYKRFYVGERNIYRIDRVFIGTTTKRELTATTDFTTSTTHGMVKFTSATTVGGSDIDTSDEVIIWYVPKAFRKLCAVRTVEKLLEKTDVMSGDSISKELQVIRERRKEYEDIIMERTSIGLSSQFENYDENYDNNLFRIEQQYSRNKYLFP